jgi:hypothetical protein
MAVFIPGESAAITHESGELGGHHTRAGCYGEEKVPSPYQESNHNSSLVQPTS